MKIHSKILYPPKASLNGRPMKTHKIVGKCSCYRDLSTDDVKQNYF